MSPNSEQLKAIEHSGGVLLKAGAGSGKTTVLIQHIIYLINLEIKKSGSDFDQFRLSLRAKLREVVLMTFTNKAAQEIKVRLKNKILEQEQNRHWDIVREEIDSLKATTIHGFFYSLIKDGLTPDIPSDLSIVSEDRSQKKIETTFNQWLEKQSTTDELVKIISLRRSAFEKSFLKIFMDADLRIRWQESEHHSFKEIFDEATTELCHLLGINKVLGANLDLSAYESQKKNKWYQFIESFQAQGFKPINKLEELQAVFQFIDGLEKSPRRPARKNNFYTADLFYDAFTELKELNKALSEPVKIILDSSNDVVKNWFDLFLSIFETIDKDYFNDFQISFSDIEYLVKKACQDPAFIKMVASRYRYFIVDEFQDTSQIQYDILISLAENDYQRLFCIGDIKQAIYGFRGGEIGVFLDLEKKIPKVLTMTNNYRSGSAIIKFNNDFFKSVLKAGIGFEGEDSQVVEFDDQSAPNADNTGLVQELKNIIDSDAEYKLKPSDLDLHESMVIFEQIQVIDLTNENVAVLYKKLKPSKLLIKLLIEKNLSFTAQVKLPLSTDPIIGLFKIFVGRLIQDQEDPYYLFMINGYLKLLNKEERDSLDWSSWTEVKSFYPLSYLFSLFLNELGLSTSQYEQSLNSVDEIIVNQNENLDLVYDHLDSLGDDNYSFNFKYGQQPEQIQIMSTHASKGLEFNHVFVGGLYTNGRAFGNKDLIGNQPGSFKFHLENNAKKTYTTPSFLLENKVGELKDFSESKRLLYVACTRAEKALYWVNLEVLNQKVSIHKNSWIQAFWKMKSELEMQTKDITNDEIHEISSAQDVPLFHHIDFGIVNRPKSELKIMSELSVTRLTTLVQCPRMFYFANILKIKPFEIEHLKTSEALTFKDDVQEEYTEGIRSNANRGTEVHAVLEHAIKHNFTLPRELKGPKDNFNWVLDYLKPFKESHDFISEEMVKFELMDYMISGIPDLIIKNKSNQSSQIIDFKTGRIKTEQNEHYWMQLYCYAFYLFQTHDQTKPIILKLIYIDQNEVLEKAVSFDQVTTELKKMFGLISKPNLINQESCSYCAYGNICQRP